jgi:hypothetical protein
MIIEAVQFMRPHGYQKIVDREISDDLAGKWKEIQDSGCRLTMEVLMTRQVSICIEDEDWGDFDSRIVLNGPEVISAVEDLIRNFTMEGFVRWKEYQQELEEKSVEDIENG